MVRRFLDCALAIVIGSLMTLASPGLSAPPLPKMPTAHSGALEYAGITRGVGEDEAAWNAIKNSRDPADFDAFIRANPGSPYAGQAKRRAQQLRQPKEPKRKAPAAVREAPQAEEPVGERPAPAPAPSAGGPVTLEAASPYPEEDYRTRSLKSYTDRVSAEADGAVTFVLFSGGQLLQQGHIPAGLSNNQVALGVFEVSELAAEAQVFSFSSLPFLARSYEDSFRLWQAARPVIQRLLAERGMMVLYAIPAVPAGLFAKKDVGTAADLKGLRMRASDEWLKRLVTEVGAKPADTSDGAAREAANANVDAMFMPLDAAAATRASGFTTAYDVQASFPLAVVVISQGTYDTLSAEIRRAFLNAAVTAQNAAWAASIDQRNTSVDLLGSKRLTVQAGPQALIADLKKASGPLVKQWLASAGSDGQLILSAFNATP